MKAFDFLASKVKTWVFILAVATVGSLNAAVFIYPIDTVFSGTAPTGPTPWATATISDVGANTVSLTMATSGLQGSEFIGEWYFNFDPTQNVTQLNFVRNTVAPPGTVVVSTGANAFSADGGGYYDILFDFPQANQPNNRFGAGQSISYTITSSSGILNAAMFDFLSSPHGDHGVWKTAVHVQNTGADREGSAFAGPGVPVPEPTTYLMLGAMLGFAIVLKKRLVKS